MDKKIVVILSMMLSMQSHAADIDNPEMFESLQKDMQEYSRIATQTKQNVDYMPYIISAWNSDELSQLGVSSLREALGLVPGVDLSVGTVGTTVPIFRGSNPFAVGQTKLVIDGVVVNDKMTGGYNHFLDMPMGMIQRIEIVRGPGSVLSYVNGYAGSIHVITKANRDDGLAVANEIYAELGSDGYKTGGFVTSHNEDEFSISSDLYYKTHDQELPVALDRYGNSGNSQERLDNYSLGVNAHYKDFSVKARVFDRSGGASYGQAFSLSEDESDFIAVQNNNIELGYSFDILKDVKIEMSLGYIELNRQLQNKVVPDGGLGLMGAPPPVILPNGQYFLVDLKEETFYERLELQVNSIDSHHINMGVYAYQSDMAKREGRASFNDMQTFITVDLLKDTPRDMFSLYLDDLIDLTEKTSIQLGIKYDYYSDVETQASPRLAMVHRYDDKNIYKFMYTESYREPAWREQYLNTKPFFSSTLDVKPENVHAYELSYIRKIDLQDYIKFNTFHLSNKEQIHAQNSTNTYKNNGDNELYGLEIEYKNEFSNNDQFYFNYSYVEGGNVAEKLASFAESMAKAYYLHNITDALTLSAIAKYIDEKDRIEADTRSNVPSYALFDLSANYLHKPTDINVNLSVKNLFDEKYYLPSPNNTYPGDFEREGRSFLFSLRKAF